MHDRVIFAGDSAHIVSPFGARGGNGGIQDIDNLGWKLAAVLGGQAGEALIATYNEERVRGADENILNSARSTSFMTPKSPMEEMFREEVLAMAEKEPFARRLVNSGRLSLPCSLAGLRLQSPDDPAFDGGLEAGSPCLDAPVTVAGCDGWLLDTLGGRFLVLSFGQPADVPDGLAQIVVLPAGSAAPVAPGHVVDREGLVAARYAGRPGAAYLIRPDQHVAARFVAPTREKLATAMAVALGGTAP